MEDFMKAGVRIPSLLANVNQACYRCFKLQGSGVVLQRCSSCKRVSYCGSECQKANWPRHKAICKAFKIVEVKYAHDVDSITKVHSNDERMVVDDPTQMHRRLERAANLTMMGLETVLGRQLDIPERNLVGWEPRCLACGHSETVFRMQAVIKNQPPSPATLKACTDCKLSFFCSEAHRELTNHGHKEVPCPTGEEGLSQCDTNKLCYQDTRFQHAMEGANMGEFKWAPERTNSAWTSLQGVDWNDFKPYLMDGTLPPKLVDQTLRSATEGLSMPMTILWALDNLNTDDAWTKKETLNIHVLGAASKEIEHSQMFEEILHRLPNVKKLKLDFIGPDLGAITGPQVTTNVMDTCPVVIAPATVGRGFKSTIQSKEYHKFVANQGSLFAKPDLAIAYNSGASQEDRDSWMSTMKLLVQRGIPSVFTAYNPGESTEESDMLRQAGASLHPALGPKRNPWGSKLLKTEPSTVTGFYSVNGWLAGGFR